MLGSSVEQRQEPGTHPGGVHRLAEQVVGRALEPVRLHVLGAEALDHPHPGDALLDHLGELSRLLLDAQHGRVQPRSRSAWPAR